MNSKKINLVCIIDDDPIFIFFTQKIFEHAGFCNHFLIYNNGQDALDNLKAIISNDENIPEVILLDLNMPIMDGWQFLDEFTKIPGAKKIHLYVVTSSIDPEDLNKVMQHELVRNYIIKPITVELLKGLFDNFEQ